MALMPLTLSVTNWTAEQVATWIRGVDNAIVPYAASFVEHNITGRHLLMLAPEDLEHLGIRKLGHQELILEITEMLVNLTAESDSETLQKVAIRVSSRTKSLLGQLKVCKGTLRNDAAVLSAATHLLEAANELTHWLCRPPFSSMQDFIDLYKQCVKDALAISNILSRSRDLQGRTDLETHLNELLGRCEDLIQNSAESLIIQPAYFETVTIRKRADEELGLHILASPTGTYEIKRIKKESVADLSGKLDEGDEIVQINYQTVIGWSLRNVVQSLRERPKEVLLTIRRRPRHFVSVTNAGAAGACHSGSANDRNPTRKQQAVPNRLSRGDTNSASSAAILKLATFPKSQKKHLSSASDEGNAVLQLASTGSFLSPTSPSTHDSQESFKDDEVFHVNDSNPSATIGNGGALSGAGDSSSTAFSSRDPVARAKPTILVTSDHWDRQGSLVPAAADSGPPTQDPPCSITSAEDKLLCSHSSALTTDNPLSEKKLGVVTSPGKQEFLSSFHVVRSVPELRQLSAGPTSVPAEQASHGGANASFSAHSDPVEANVAGPVVVPLSAEEKREATGGLKDNMAAKYVDHDKEMQYLSATYVTKREKKGRDGVSQVGTRLISVIDLGRGEIEGWLYMKGSKSDKWAKTYKWCVLKRQDLYCYNDKMSTQATCHICLPMFKVSDAPECKGRKYPFKVHNAGTTFYFAADKPDDRLEWMKKLGLAAILYNPPPPGGAGRKGAAQGADEEGFSESDTDSLDISGSSTSSVYSTVTLRRKTKLQQALSSNDALRHMVKSIREANLDLTGTDRSTRHMSRLSLLSCAAKGRAMHSSFIVGELRLKQRQLKALEEEWQDIEELERSVTSEKLKAFMMKYEWLQRSGDTRAGTGPIKGSSVAAATARDSSSDDSFIEEL